jgi:imidazolonepropionase-like amidohydrolase
MFNRRCSRSEWTRHATAQIIDTQQNLSNWRSVVLVLRGGTLVDGTGAEPIGDATVTIADDRITAVTRGTPPAGIPETATVLDTDGLALLPGLIDLHSHLGIVAPGDPTSLSPAMTAALLFQNAELCLMSGHTTTREVAGADGALREVIDAGVIPGPRLYPSGPLLAPTGGHATVGSLFYPHHHVTSGTPGLSQMSVTCDGPDSVRIAARQAFRQGATQIKMTISGGVISHSDRLEDTQFSVAELRAAVEEAQARETYVTGHAHNSRAINNGLDAGMECFEHGTFLDEATAARMASAGAALVPTLTITHLAATRWREMGFPEEALPRLQGVFDAMAASVKLAHDSGVLVGSGTDILGPKQNQRGLELALKAGVLGPMAAIVSATSVNARILRNPDLGVVAEGRLADVIAVQGDPLTNADVFADPANVVLVVKGGVVVKDIRS